MGRSGPGSSGFFGFRLRFSSVTGFFKPAPSPKPRPKPKILAAHRYIFSVNAPSLSGLVKPVVFRSFFRSLPMVTPRPLSRAHNRSFSGLKMVTIGRRRTSKPDQTGPNRTKPDQEMKYFEKGKGAGASGECEGLGAAGGEGY